MGTKTLLVLRHGKSSWSDPALADHDRPLKSRGRSSAKRIGELLAAHGLLPELALCSTARRASDTARLALAAAGSRVGATATPELYGGGAGRHLELIAHASGAAVETVLVVGHNPDLEALVERLTGEPVELKTAYLAVVDLPLDSWAGLPGARGTLRQLLRPTGG